MVVEFYPIDEPHIFQASDATQLRPHSSFQVEPNQQKSLQPDMQPIHTWQVTPEDIQGANATDAVMVEVITRKYACKSKAQVPPSFPKGETSTTRVSKNNPPLLPLPIQSKSFGFSLEN
jgi:hypothetical protein